MSKQVIVYTTKNCVKCKQLKTWLRRNKIAFVTKSLDDTNTMTDLVMRNIVILSAPALETETKFFLSDQIFLPDNSLNPDFKEIFKGEI